VLIGFYKSTSQDHKGRTIDDIFAFDDFWLEHTHDYIQWLFPIPEKGRFNGYAPLLTEPARMQFRRDEELLARQRYALDLMLRFFGLYRQDDKISLCETLNPKKHIWLKSGGHNHLRISRIIRSLHFCGQEDLAQLVQHGFITIGRSYGQVSEKSLAFWESSRTHEGFPVKNIDLQKIQKTPV